MHYTLLLQIMHHNGLGDLIDRHDDSGVRFRKLMSDVVLATDMSVHGEFMRRFGELVEGKEEPGKEVACRVTLMCQALIKCADISNPVSPLYSFLSYLLYLIIIDFPIESTPRRITTLGLRVKCRMDFSGPAGRALPFTIHPQAIYKPPRTGEFADILYNELRQAIVGSHCESYPS